MKNETVGEKVGGAIGKEIGKHIGKEVEQEITGQKRDRKDKTKSPVARRVGYAIALILTLLFLWIINNYDDWGWTFVTGDWSQVDAIVRTSIIVDIIGYGILMLIDARLVFYLIKLTMDVFNIIVGIRVFQVYPFDFTGRWNWLDTVFPVLIILGLVATAISIIVRTTKLAAGKEIYN